MSLEGIKRSTFETEKYSDNQVITFRRLYNLSRGSAEEKAQFKSDAAKLDKKIDLPLFAQYNKEAGAHVQALLKKQAEAQASIAASEIEIRKHETKIENIENRIAVLDIKDQVLLTKFSSDLGQKLQATVNPNSGQMAPSTSRNVCK